MKNIDADKIRRQIQEAMRSVDAVKIQKEIQESLSKVDFDKIKEEVNESLKKVDFNKIQIEVKEALDKVDMNEIREEIAKAGDEVNRELKDKDWKKEMESATDKLKHMKDEFRLENLDMKGVMEKAGDEIDKAKDELKGYQEMIYALESDGLLDTKEDYVIKYRDSELYINGKKQSPETSAKYKKYFKQNKVTIRKEDGDFDIKHGDSNVHID